MSWQDDKYIEIAIGHPGNRGVVIPLGDLKTKLENNSLFRSLYCYDFQLVEHFSLRKTVKGFKGKYYLDRIIIDIDKGTDSDQACLDRAKNAVENLILGDYDFNPDHVLPWYSGNGYHIEIPDVFDLEPSHDLPSILKASMKKYFPHADNIYDGARLIRVGFTPNEKTQEPFYKTPYTVDEFMAATVDDIQELAKQPRWNFKFQSMPRAYSLFEPVTEQPVTQPKVLRFQPGAVVTCVQKMYQEGDVRGSRHNKILRLASSFRRHGVPRPAIDAALIPWAQSLESGEVIRLVDDVFTRGYQYGCKDWLMDKYCDPKCAYFQAKAAGEDILVPIMSAKEMEKSFITHIRTDYGTNAFDLNDIWNLGSPYKIIPGELVTVEGKTGIGKTAWVQNICLEIDMPVMWLSLEMGPELMYRRFIQIAEGKTKQEVIDHYKRSDNTWSKKIDQIQLVAMPPRLEMIRGIISTVNIGMLVVDTIDCIVVKGYHDSMVKIDKIVAELRQLATLQGVIIVMITHITKTDARENKLDAHSGKHSTSIGDKSDKVIAIHGDPALSQRLITSVKARDESSFRIVGWINPDTFRFSIGE